MGAAGEGPDELRSMRQAQHLHDLGPRAAYEYLAELAADPITRVDIEVNLAQYCRLTSKMVNAVGARGLRVPVFVVDDDNAVPVQAMRGAA